LGPNGAGKTTTIRLLMNLINPTIGDVYIFDRQIRSDPRSLSRVGAIVEDASFYHFLSGQENLEVLAKTRGCFKPERILIVLEQVGLKEYQGLKVGGYSTGMKQRLGLAAAMLSDPDLLILDEPTRGLDPSGMREIRVLIRELSVKDGKTIFLSSHLLNEVEQVCDRVAIIVKGEVVKEGRISDLLARDSELLIEASPLSQALSVLSQHWQVVCKDQFLIVSANHKDAPIIVRILTKHDIDVFKVTSHHQSLEDYFLTVTGDNEINE